MSKLADFLAELKRRRVYRVTAVYAGVAFVIGTLAVDWFPEFNIPPWATSLVLLIIVLGFPIVVALAWAFDITDKGIVRTSAKTRAETTSRRPIFSNTVVGIVVVLAILVAVWSLLRGPSLGGTTIRSIAVLPLNNLMGPENEDYVDGLTENITHKLSQIGALRVTAGTSAMMYKNNYQPWQIVAGELGVDAFTEGSIQESEGEILVIIQLIDGRSGVHLWSGEYYAELKDNLVLQGEIALAIVNELMASLTPEEEIRITTTRPVDPDAWQFYSIGWQLRNQYNYPKAVEYLEQAVAIDPDFAPGWSALAVCYGLGSGGRDSLLVLMNEALDRALELDSDDVIALAWQAFLVYSGDQSPSANATAEIILRRALELEPSNSNARWEYGLFLERRTIRISEALAELKLALSIDPLYASYYSSQGVGGFYYRFRQYDKALEHYQTWLELAPGDARPLRQITHTKIGKLLQQGLYAEAAAMAGEAAAEAGGMSVKRGFFWQQLRAEGASGNREKADAIHDSLIATGGLPEQELDDPGSYASYYSIIGEKDKALELLEGYTDANPDDPQRWLITDIDLDPLRAEPRFKELMQELGLPEFFDQNGNLLIPLDETLEAYNAPGRR